jgi:hypothetical protein
MARTKKADRLAATPPTRKQMWVYTDKWVELHSEVERLKVELERLQSDYFQAEEGCGILRKEINKLKTK